MSIGRRVFGELDDLRAGFFDGDPIGVEGGDDVVVVIDSTGDLTVGREIGSCGEEEGCAE